MSKEAFPEEPFPQSKEGFFLGLHPLHGALGAVEQLRQLYDVYILTAPSTRNPLCYTEKRLWVEKYLGYEMVKRLIICPNKSLLKGGYLIDDNVDGKGQEDFEGMVIHFASEAYPDWATVLDSLLKQKARSSTRKGLNLLLEICC